jgi:hypothetical protein
LKNTHLYKQGLGLFAVAEDCFGQLKGRPTSAAREAMGHTGLLVQPESVA